MIHSNLPSGSQTRFLKSPSLYRVFLSLSAYLGELSCRFFLNVRFHQTFQLHGNTLVALFPKKKELTIKVVLPICFSLRFGGAYFFSDETVVCIVSPFLIV